MPFEMEQSREIHINQAQRTIWTWHYCLFHANDWTLKGTNQGSDNMLSIFIGLKMTFKQFPPLYIKKDENKPISYNGT